MPFRDLPIGLALIPCDTLIEDVRTKKKSLIGLFSQILTDSFPYTHPSLNLLVSLTGCVGSTPCTIVCEKSDDKQKIVDVLCQINAKSPMDVVDMVINLKSLVFPAPGRYDLKVLVDRIPVMMRPIKVLSKVKPPSVPPMPPSDNENF